MTLTSSVPVLRVSDYDRARAFWRDVLRFEIVEEAGEPQTGFGIYRSGKATVFLLAWDGPEAAYEGWRAYFHTDDLDGIAAQLTAKNTPFKGPVTTEYAMREIEVADPDGNTVCFGQDT
ncbi:MAG: glyoxalase superfamily protein [Pseudomonadota bacterium]